jgi:hypothetical protein
MDELGETLKAAAEEAFKIAAAIADQHGLCVEKRKDAALALWGDIAGAAEAAGLKVDRHSRTVAVAVGREVARFDFDPMDGTFKWDFATARAPAGQQLSYVPHEGRFVRASDSKSGSVVALQMLKAALAPKT